MSETLIFNLPDVARQYKAPAISMLPLFDLGMVSLTETDNASRFLQPDAVFLPSGRVAIYYALLFSGVSSQDQVLLPAYHCGSMIEPVIHLGAESGFYHLGDGLEVQVDILEEFCTPKTKAIIVPHYFGFTQNLLPIKQWCDSKGIALIEDCAHSFFTHEEGASVGTTGHYAIASTVKFFPGTQGGAIVSNHGRKLDLDLSRPSGFQELKAIKNLIEIKAAYRGQRNSGDAGATSDVPSQTELVTFNSRKIKKGSYLWFDEKQIGLSNLRVNEWLIRNSAYQRIKNKRIDNYNYYLKKIREVPALVPFRPELGADIPYVFPVLLDRSEEVFHRLKFGRVPMWRWEELALTSCKVSQVYRHSLIQLPCHQSISHSDVDWILRRVKKLI